MRSLTPSLSPTTLKRLETLALACGFVLGSLAGGCTGEFDLPEGNGSIGEGFDEFLGGQESATTIGAHLYFRQDYFYSLLEPNDEGCPGDARIFHEIYPIASDGTVTPSYHGGQSLNFPVPFAPSTVSNLKTRKPDFLKNVSVDLTDANTEDDKNLAFDNCSLQNNLGAPPPSACARFDLRVSDLSEPSLSTRDPISQLFSSYEPEVLASFQRERYWGLLSGAPDLVKGGDFVDEDGGGSGTQF
ncbi:MAG: hypothetical protein IT285_15450, partial [Bdellovibrionales bacterium]|nr:hypothetical protein [Bdellovibrionales bacterium]